MIRGGKSGSLLPFFKPLRRGAAVGASVRF